MHLEQSKNISFILKEFHKITFFPKQGRGEGAGEKLPPDLKVLHSILQSLEGLIK